MIENTNDIKPSGDHFNDGAMQLSFTLGFPLQMAQIAAIEVCRKMNLKEIEIASLNPLSPELTYVQVFAKTDFSIPIPEQAAFIKPLTLNHQELLKASGSVKKKIIVVGACTGSDAHTTGLDAILNKKGYKGDKGLESYPFLSVVNLGSQVKNSELIGEIIKNNASVLLVSQVITQQNVHLHNLAELKDMLDAAKLRNKLLCIIGGPRISNHLAIELGFDAGFGIGTLPVDVASFIYMNHKN